MELGKKYRLINTEENVQSEGIMIGTIEGTLITLGMEDCKGIILTDESEELRLAEDLGEELTEEHYWLAFDEPKFLGSTIYGILSKHELERLEEIK